MAEELNLKMTKEEVERAKTDTCIVGRLVEVVQQLKQCRSEVRPGPCDSHRTDHISAPGTLTMLPPRTISTLARI